MFEKLTWCIAHLGKDANWWVDSLSDETHWEMGHLGLIDPHQLEYLWELFSPLRDCGFQEELWEMAFCKFRIEEELPQERIQLTAVEMRLAKAEEKLFLLPYAHSDSEERYTELLEHLMQLRVKWLNMIFDFKQPLELEDIETYFRNQESEKNLEEGARHVFGEIASILEYTPAGLESDEGRSEALDGELEEDSEGMMPEMEEEGWEEELKEDIYRLEIAD
jgi:hypothetical protein